MRSLVQQGIVMASKSRQDKINYIRRLGYSEKLADEVLRKNGDRLSESELLRHVMNEATKSERTKPKADYLNHQDSFRKQDGTALKKPIWKRKRHT
eukprot:sb/3479119/